MIGSVQSPAQHPRVTLSLDRLGLLDLDAESGEAHIGELLRGEQPDRGNAEITEDLRAEPDLAPLARARRLRTRIARRNGVNRHARHAVAQEHEDAAAVLLEASERRVHGLGAAENVANDIGAMQPRK